MRGLTTGLSFNAASTVTGGGGDVTAPTITSADPSGTYDEGDPVGGTLTANETATFSVTGTDAAAVTLDPDTGVWSLEATDYETKTSYSFSFIATDAAENASDPQVVAITIADVDEVAPTITSSSSANVAENATLSHSLTANESVSWTIIGGADQAQFEISGSTLRWASNGTRDYESPADQDTNNAYVVQVRATDGASNTADQTITINVTDVAEGGWTGAPRTGSPETSHTATSDVTSFTVTLAPHEAGDLLVIILAIDGNATISCTGWTSAYNATNSTNARLVAFVRDTVAASNAETNPTFTISAAQQGSALAYSIPGGNPAKVAAGAGTTGATASPDPTAVTPGGTEDYLYLAIMGADNNSNWTVTGFPSGYTNTASAFNGNTASAIVATAQKSTTASTSDNPSAFTLSGSEQWIANTLAFWP